MDLPDYQYQVGRNALYFFEHGEDPTCTVEGPKPLNVPTALEKLANALQGNNPPPIFVIENMVRFLANEVRERDKALKQLVDENTRLEADQELAEEWIDRFAKGVNDSFKDETILKENPDAHPWQIAILTLEAL